MWRMQLSVMERKTNRSTAEGKSRLNFTEMHFDYYTLSAKVS